LFGIAVANHADGNGGPEAPRTSPYRAFLDALEELSLTISLHGTASAQAHLARAHVRDARGVAAEAWRRRQRAA
jgi:hypothetical protein